MAGYLAIPLKKTSEVDLIKPLSGLAVTLMIKPEEKDQFTAAVNRLNSMRKSATWKTLDKHQASLDAMALYYDELCGLSSKLPDQDVSVSFKWKDAFNKSGFFGSSISLTLHCFGYEKSCILFNYGAMLSQIAASHGADISDDESLKTSTKYFQMAAGVYHHLRTFAQSVTQESLTVDLHPDTLTVLYTLCLAQAQEGFYHKATSDGKKDSLLAQVASQCEDLYADALKLMSRDHLRCVFDKDWFSVLTLKEHAFKAVTHYHKGLQARADKEVGEELARFQVALENFKVVQSKIPQITSIPIGEQFLEMSRKANRYYEDTKKDNDFIYHARIPELKQLATIKPAVVAKAIALSPPLTATEKRENLFDMILPASVTQGCQKLVCQKTVLENEELGKLKQATQLLNGVLSSLNLPAAIEDVPGGAQLPPSIQRKAKEVKEKGGLKALEAKMNELGPQLQRNREIVDESKRMLDDEEQTDQNLKQRFKERWTRIPSTNLNQPMRETLKKYSSIIDKAVAADKVVQEKFQQHRYSMLLLDGSETELSGNIPKGSTGVAGNGPESQTLKTLMQQVDKLQNEREVLQHEFKSTNLDMKDEFLRALAADGVINDVSMTTEAIHRVYGPLQQRVKESLQTQETLIVQIQSAHQEFVRRSGGSGDKRGDVLKELAAAHSAFTEILANLNEGLQFYGELTNLLLNHQTKINDFCFARQTEKEELVKDLTKSFAGAASLPAGSAVPSQPPAYQTNASQTAPSTAPPPMGSHDAAPPTANVPLPYPQQPQGMPQPYYPYPSYPMVYQVPMPTSYNPYAMPPGYQPPYNQQQFMPYQQPGMYQPPPPPQ